MTDGERAIHAIIETCQVLKHLAAEIRDEMLGLDDLLAELNANNEQEGNSDPAGLHR